MISELDALHQVQKYAGPLSVGTAYNSDIFGCLAAILAYYKVRGTEPKDMLSPELLIVINRMVDSHEQE